MSASSLLVEPPTCHRHPEGSVVTTARLLDGRVLRVIGPGDTFTEMVKTIRWMSYNHSRKVVIKKRR